MQLTPRTSRVQGGEHLNLRRFEVNDDYFTRIDTPAKAYILGLLASDGNLQKGASTIRLRIKEGDAGILEKIKKEMGIERSIRYHSYGKCKIGDLSFSSKKIYQDLKNAGLNPSTKSLDLKYPSKNVLPQDLDRHFIRGIFDGDGSISVYNKKGFPEFKMNFTGTRDILEEITQKLHGEIGSKAPNIRKDERTVNNCIASISGTGNVGKIYMYMYGENFDIFKDLALERKYNRMKFAYDTWKESQKKQEIPNKKEMENKIRQKLKERPMNTSEISREFNFEYKKIQKIMETMGDVEKIYLHNRTGPGHTWSIPGLKVKGHVYPDEVSKEMMDRSLNPSQIETYIKAVKAGYFDLTRNIGNKDLAKIWGEGLGNVQKKMTRINRALLNELNKK